MAVNVVSLHKRSTMKNINFLFASLKKTLLTSFLSTIIISVFHLHHAWSDFLQDVRKSVFSINGVDDSTRIGFVVEGDILVASFFHVFITGGGDLRSLSIENSNGEKFQIEGVRGIDSSSNIVLLKIKDYEGPWLKLESSSEPPLSNKCFLVENLYDGLQTIDLVKGRGYTDGLTQSFSRIYSGKFLRVNGAPIVNEMGAVVAVARRGDPNWVSGIRKERLQELLDRTRNQELISDGDDREEMNRFIKQDWSTAQDRLHWIFLNEVESGREERAIWKDLMLDERLNEEGLFDNTMDSTKRMQDATEVILEMLLSGGPVRYGLRRILRKLEDIRRTQEKE